VKVAGYWNGLWTVLTPLDSTKDSVGYLLSFPATKVAKSSVRCGGGDAVASSRRAISHFIEKNKHCPLFLASSLLSLSEKHRGEESLIK
jgi:hypothetical protein